ASWLLVFLCSPSALPASRPPRRLHSFPTRRSSDLLDAVDQNAEELGVVGARMRHRLLSTARPIAPSRTSRSNGLAMQPSPDDAQDRKSTRLNSSHVEISYAVFCLKKKKQTTHSGPT